MGQTTDPAFDSANSTSTSLSLYTYIYIYICVYRVNPTKTYHRPYDGSRVGLGQQNIHLQIRGHEL